MVTVIIPTYKGEDKIEEAVESVLQQTYKDIEVIVVDDNGQGTPNQIATEKAVQKFFSDKRFKYIVHEKNKNGSAARNTGIKNSTGEFIGFLDDDDVFMPEKIEKQVALFSSLGPEYGLVYGSFKEIIDERHSRILQADKSDNFLFDFLCDKIIACSSTVLIRRNVLDKVKEWDESFRRHQDLEFFARVAFYYKVAYIPDICIEKRKLDRNTAKGEVYEEYHLHYINKMQGIVDTFTEKQKKEFYDHHYFEMGKAYIKEKNISRALYWAKRSSNPPKMVLEYLVAAASFAIRRLF
jgi:glycosyltransferase involved in cell wall biosynthesis